MFRLTALSLCLLVAGCGTLGAGQAGNGALDAYKAYDVKQTNDISYLNENSLQRLDIFAPQGSGGHPLLMFIHGGGWARGDKRAQAAICERFARAGVLTASINYRLSPRFKHPAHVEDVAAALAWLVKNAGAYGWDGRNIFISGHSAGGHLALLVSLDERYLAAHGLSTRIITGVLPISAAVSLRVQLPGNRPNTMITQAFADNDAQVAQARPATYARADAPPMLLTVGDAELGLMGQDRALVQALTAAGAKDITLKVMPGRDHRSIRVGIATDDDPTGLLMIDFMRRLAQ